MISLTLKFSPDEFDAFSEALGNLETAVSGRMTMETLINFLIAKFNEEFKQEQPPNQNTINFHFENGERCSIQSISRFNGSAWSAN